MSQACFSILNEVKLWQERTSYFRTHYRGFKSLGMTKQTLTAQ